MSMIEDRGSLDWKGATGGSKAVDTDTTVSRRDYKDLS